MIERAALQRVEEVIEWMVFNRIIKNRRELADKLGYTESSLSQIMNGRVPLSSRFMRRLQEFCPQLNGEWMMRGVGERFVAAGAISAISPRRDSTLCKAGVPYYENIETYVASLLSSGENAKPTYYIDFPPLNEATVYLPVRGESMMPDYCPGEIIAVQRVFNQELIQWGETYFIITTPQANNLKTLKRLYPATDPNTFLLRSANADYQGDISLPKAEIVALYIVKGKIKQNIY